VARHVKQEAWSLFPDLKPMYVQHRARIARDSLCLLYVAMTRARSALHMVINPMPEREKTLPATYAGILRDAFSAEGIDPDSVAYSHGDGQWHVRAAPHAEMPGVAAEPERIGLARASGRVPRGRVAASASALADGADAARAMLSVPDFAARERGIAIHAMFETIEWIEEYSPDRDDLVRIAARLSPRRGMEWATELVESFLAMIERPQVRCALSRRGIEGKSDVRNEVPFACLVDGSIRSGMIDRLVVKQDNGRITGAIVLDFKTDMIDASRAAERAEHHRLQLEAYRDAAAEMLGLKRESVAMSVLFVECGEVVTVP
jgi:ATP-dependent helicase/nuclease subunit A